jgi:hypothetical protein
MQGDMKWLHRPWPKVRDLWAKKDLGSKTGSFTAAGIPSHGTTLVKLSWA